MKIFVLNDTGVREPMSMYTMLLPIEKIKYSRCFLDLFDCMHEAKNKVLNAIEIVGTKEVMIIGYSDWWDIVETEENI
jgi:hypothetical protein